MGVKSERALVSLREESETGEGSERTPHAIWFVSRPQLPQHRKLVKCPASVFLCAGLRIAWRSASARPCEDGVPCFLRRCDRQRIRREEEGGDAS